MSKEQITVVLNLSINATYFPLFKDENALKYLGNELLKDYGKTELVDHEEIPDWKMGLLTDLAKVLMTEEDGRVFLSQVSRAYAEGHVLNESGVKKNLVFLLFCKLQDETDDTID